MWRACFGSWIKERQVYSCVARRLRDCGSSIKEHDCGTAGAAFQVRYLVGRVFCNLAANITDVFRYLHVDPNL